MEKLTLIYENTDENGIKVENKVTVEMDALPLRICLIAMTDLLHAATFDRDMIVEAMNRFQG